MQKQSQFFQLSITTPEGEDKIKILQSHLTLTVAQYLSECLKKQPYSKEISIYQQPLFSFNTLPFIDRQISLKELLKQFPNICLTRNNFQFIQKQQSVSLHDYEPMLPECVFIVIQAKQDTYFYHQVFNLSLDCKILFLVSLAERYGKNASLLYHQFRVPLTMFDSQQTIKETLFNYCQVSNHIIIAVDCPSQAKFIKTVSNPKIVDSNRYRFMKLDNYSQFLVISKEVSWRAVGQLLEIIFQCDMQVVDEKRQVFQWQALEKIEKNELTIVKKPQQKQELPIAIKNCLFVGTTKQFLCFVQQSHILHLFSIHPPYQLINSSLLHCPPDRFLQQEIPVLHQDKLIMYNITRWAIILKQYTLPSSVLTNTKHFNWYPNKYGPIKCETLDVLALPLRDQQKVRVFNILKPNDFMDIDCHQSKWNIWISKIWQNNFSDGSGLFAILNELSRELSIFCLNSKRYFSSLQVKSVQHVVFNPQLALLLIRSDNNYIQYNYQTGQRMKTYETAKHEKMYYSPSAEILSFTFNSFTQIGGTKTIKIDSECLMKEGDAFFSKDPPKLMHTISGIQTLKLRSLRQTLQIKSKQSQNQPAFQHQLN